jgi:hypothetical protein
MKVLQACSGGKTQTVWTGTIRQLLHDYLGYRNKRRVPRRDFAENRLLAYLEGRRWCDATERELIGDMANGHRLHF